MIQVGDKVRVKLESEYYIKHPPGEVIRIMNYPNGLNIAVVRFPNNTLQKVLLSDLEKVDDSIEVTLTLEKLNELKEKILDKNSVELEGTNYEILRLTGELIFKRLESELFGGGNTPEG